MSVPDEKPSLPIQILYNAIQQNKQGGWEFDEPLLKRFREEASKVLGTLEGPSFFFEFFGLVASVAATTASEALAQRLVNELDQLIKPEHHQLLEKFIEDKRNTAMDSGREFAEKLATRHASEAAVPEPSEKIPISVTKTFKG